MKPNTPASCLLAFFLAGTGLGLAKGDTVERWTDPAVPDGIRAALTTWAKAAVGSPHPATNSLRLVLRGGRYWLAQTIRLSEPEGVGAITLQAAPGEQPVLCGGREVGPWHPLHSIPPALPEIARGKVWAAPAPQWAGKVACFRELWVNGNRAVRAQEPNEAHFARLVAWDKTKQIATIPSDLWPADRVPPGLEMVVDQVWEIANLRIDSWHRHGRYAEVRFQQPESRLEFNHPWPPVTVDATYQAPYYLVNALELLDSPGEWYEDLATGMIYYWPRPGEELTHARVVAPLLETLLEVAGSPTHPVANLHFSGITFANTTWLRPSEQGHVPLQAGMFLLDAHKLKPKGTVYAPKLDNVAWIGRPPAAVQLNYATNVTFDHCTFEQLAAAGLDVGTGCHAVTVQGCLFREIGGNGLQLGRFSDPGVETHQPYRPANEAEVCSDIHVANNFITRCGLADWGCVGIAAGYVRNTRMEHNDISVLPYTGISLGWGWTKMTNAMRDNLIAANYVHQVGQRLGDLGGIYTLSAQPGTLVQGNVIEDLQPSAEVPDPEHWFYLYTDEGSAGITLRDNWCPSAKFLANANGPGNSWINNGPAVSAAIKNQAGLEPRYQYLIKSTIP